MRKNDRLLTFVFKLDFSLCGWDLCLLVLNLRIKVVLLSLKLYDLLFPLVKKVLEMIDQFWVFLYRKAVITDSLLRWLVRAEWTVFTYLSVTRVARILLVSKEPKLFPTVETLDNFLFRLWEVELARITIILLRLSDLNSSAAYYTFWNVYRTSRRVKLRSVDLSHSSRLFKRLVEEIVYQSITTEI
jgi:hypothetical protein